VLARVQVFRGFFDIRTARRGIDVRPISYSPVRADGEFSSPRGPPERDADWHSMAQGVVCTLFAMFVQTTLKALDRHPDGRVLGTSPRRQTKAKADLDRSPGPDHAKQHADEIAAAFGAGPPPAEGLTLYRLFDMYLGEVTPTKGERKQGHDRASAEMFLRFFGCNCKPDTLNRRDGTGSSKSGGRVASGRKGRSKREGLATARLNTIFGAYSPCSTGQRGRGTARATYC
jgi:hypothetical protein